MKIRQTHVKYQVGLFELHLEIGGVGALIERMVFRAEGVFIGACGMSHLKGRPTRTVRLVPSHETKPTATNAIGARWNARQSVDRARHAVSLLRQVGKNRALPIRCSSAA